MQIRTLPAVCFLAASLARLKLRFSAVSQSDPSIYAGTFTRAWLQLVTQCIHHSEWLLPSTCLEPAWLRNSTSKQLYYRCMVLLILCTAMIQKRNGSDFTFQKSQVIVEMHRFLLYSLTLVHPALEIKLIKVDKLIILIKWAIYNKWSKLGISAF